MIRQTNTYLQSRKAGNKPVYLAFISSSRTRRCFAKLAPTETQMGTTGGLELFDGTYSAGDGGDFSSDPVAEWGARILNFGGFRRTLTPSNHNLIASLNETEMGAFSITLDNADSYFSRMMGDDLQETFLLQTVEIMQGFLGCTYADFVRVFYGSVTELRVDNKTMTLMCEPYAIGSPVGGGGGFTPSSTMYGVEDTGLGIMATDTLTDAVAAPLFFGTMWSLIVNFDKHLLDDAGIIFELVNSVYSAIRLQVGVDVDNHLYVTVGTDVTGAFSTTTYTDTYTLGVSDLARHINARIDFDGGENDITFTVNGNVTTQAATTDFDVTESGSETLAVGEGFDGIIQSVKFFLSGTATWFVINNTSDNTLTDWPEVVGDLDLPLDDGTWAVWT